MAVNRNDQEPLHPRRIVRTEPSPEAARAALRARLVLVALAASALLCLPGALAHGAGHGLDDQLVADGERLLVGDFTAPQPGPLIVVPYTDGPLGCDADAAGGDTTGTGYRIALDGDRGVMFAANATHLQALVDAPPTAAGYAGFAVDTHDATRALIMMQENAVALHALVAVRHETTDNETLHEARTGVLGVPYALGPAAGHGHGDEGARYRMTHDGSFGEPRWCTEGESGHVMLAFDRADLPRSLTHGALVHVVVLVDPALGAFLPRAIDGSTAVFEANLYLARPGEDPARVRAALDPSAAPQDVVPVVLTGLALVWVVGRARA